MLDFGDCDFYYEPYPMGYVRKLIDPGMFDRLADTFPSYEIMSHRMRNGDRWLLNEWANSGAFHRFVRRCAPWRDFYRYVKSPEFSDKVFDLMEERNIDFGLREEPLVNIDKLNPAVRVAHSLRHALHCTLLNRDVLSSHFEFSAVRMNSGGFLRPHTDATSKLVAIVVCMMKDGEWPDPSVGGTSICKPKDPARIYNYLNEYRELDDFDVVRQMPFEPNCGTVFVKGYNSWHAVWPVDGVHRDIVRKSILIHLDYSRKRSS